MGYGAFIITYFLDYLVRNLSTTKLYITKSLYIATVLLGFFATVNVWRGLWSMLDHYFLPKLNLDENYIIRYLRKSTKLNVLQGVPEKMLPC